MVVAADIDFPEVVKDVGSIEPEGGGGDDGSKVNSYVWRC